MNKFSLIVPLIYFFIGNLQFFVDMTMFVLITFWCLQHSNDRVEFWLGLEFKVRASNTGNWIVFNKH